jgi:PKHD-type hydroxylase
MSNITHFAYWYFDEIIPKNLCNEIIKFGLSKKDQIAWTGDKKPDERNKKEIQFSRKIRKSNVTWLSEPWIYEELNQVIHKANQNAGWNYQWDYNEACQFTIYKKGQFYDWHCDNYKEPYKEHVNPNLIGKTRKLSLTLQLSDPKDYSGGELEFDMTVNKNKPYREVLKNKPQGTIVVFPSFIEHRVKPVKKGIRYSLVNWSCGQPWK